MIRACVSLPEPKPSEPKTKITEDVLKSELYAEAKAQRTSKVNNKKEAFMRGIDFREKAKAKAEEAAKKAKEAAAEIERLNAEAEKAEREAGITK